MQKFLKAKISLVLALVLVLAAVGGTWGLHTALPARRHSRRVP